MDNRIRLPSSEIDFTTEVGLSGQDHDNYAEPGTIPRYDWMRMIVLGLLSNQASDKEPTQYRQGTIWYNNNDQSYKTYIDDEFKDIAHCIKINNDKLQNWLDIINKKISLLMPTGTFSGIAYGHTKSINIPRQLQPISVKPNRPYVFKNGMLINLELTKFNFGCPTCIELDDEAALEENDKFTVIIKR